MSLPARNAISSAAVDELHTAARDIFTHALAECSIPVAFDRHMHFEGNVLVRHPVPQWRSTATPLDTFRKIFVIALGKAALPMLDTLLDRMPRRLSIRGVCSAPSLPKAQRRRIRYYAGGHPLPNKDSLRAAQAALMLLKSARKDTFVFFLISGGGSAMFERPLDRCISLEDTSAFHEALIGCGATIVEINALRKHFSAVKGGRLAAAAPHAARLSLLVSDVPLRNLDALASAPTLPDRSTVQECREILARYQLMERFPPSVRAFFADPGLPETPGSKQSHPSQSEPGGENGGAEPERFGELDTLLSNHDLVNAARDRAQALGYKVVIDNTCDDWDYREAAKYLLARLRELRREHPRLCLLSGGEVTVRLDQAHGTGGRNQQFALACAMELAGRSMGSPETPATNPGFAASGAIAVLSAGTDGVDGNSPAAGAIADVTTIARAEAHAFDPVASLARFDACPLLTALGDTIVTGPTHNNLRDLRILLSVRTEGS